jgi:diacylglycerol kinase (ATP)
MSALGRLLRGFPPALQGLRALVRDERHARFHLAATLTVAASAAILHVDRDGVLWLVLAVALVWTAEAFNAAIERLADRITTEHDPAIGLVKDLAAGAVLVTAVAAAVIGALVFAPYVRALFVHG